MTFYVLITAFTIAQSNQKCKRVCVNQYLLTSSGTCTTCSHFIKYIYPRIYFVYSTTPFARVTISSVSSFRVFFISTTSVALGAVASIPTCFLSLHCLATTVFLNYFCFHHSHLHSFPACLYISLVLPTLSSLLNCQRNTFHATVCFPNICLFTICYGSS